MTRRCLSPLLAWPYAPLAWPYALLVLPCALLACTGCAAPPAPSTVVVAVGPATFAIDAPSVAALDPFADARIAVGASLAGSLTIRVVDEGAPARDTKITLPLDGALRIPSVPFGDQIDVAIDVVEPGGVVVGRGLVAGVTLAERAVIDVPVRKPIAYVADAAFPGAGDGAVSAVDLSSLADDGLGDGGKVAARVDEIGGDLAGTAALALTDDARFLAIADASPRLVVLDTKTDAPLSSGAVALPEPVGALLPLPGDRFLALPAAGADASSVLVVGVGGAGPDAVESIALAASDLAGAIIDTRGADLVDAHTAIVAVEIDPAGGGEFAGVARVDLAVTPPAVKIVSKPNIAEAHDIRVIGKRAYLLGNAKLDVVDVDTLLGPRTNGAPIPLPVNDARHLSVYASSTTKALVVDTASQGSLVVAIDGTVLAGPGLASLASAVAVPDGTVLGVGGASISLENGATPALTSVAVAGFGPVNLVDVAVPFSLRL